MSRFQYSLSNSSSGLLQSASPPLTLTHLFFLLLYLHLFLSLFNHAHSSLPVLATCIPFPRLLSFLLLLRLVFLTLNTSNIWWTSSSNIMFIRLLLLLYHLLFFFLLHPVSVPDPVYIRVSFPVLCSVCLSQPFLRFSKCVPFSSRTDCHKMQFIEVIICGLICSEITRNSVGGSKDLRPNKKPTAVMEAEDA